LGRIGAVSKDQLVEGIAEVLRLTPEVRERYADVIDRAADDVLLDHRLRQRIDRALTADPVSARRLPAVVLELEDVLARIRATGEARPEVACETLRHLLEKLAGRLTALPDTEMLRALCAQLCDATVTVARRVHGAKAHAALANLLDAYLDDRANRWPPVPALLARARFGKRIRRWLAAEVASRSDTADPGRAERLETLADALAADRQ
jgi:hypothetical protein